MHENDETSPEHRPFRVGATEVHVDQDQPELALGSRPALDLRADAGITPVHAARVTRAVVWFGAKQIDVETDGDAISLILLKTLRVIGTADEATALAHALLRAAAQQRR